MILLDSSVVISLFRKEEELHLQALSIWESGADFILLDYVMSEVLTVLKIRESHEIAVHCAEFLVNNKRITIEQLKKTDLQETVHFFKKNRNRLSFVDTALLVQSKKRKIPLATFDKDLGLALKK